MKIYVIKLRDLVKKIKTCHEIMKFLIFFSFMFENDIINIELKDKF